jgi:hypothetical protein
MCSAEPPLGTQGGTALKVHNRFWRVPDLSSPSVDVRFGAAVAPQDFGRDGRIVLKKSWNDPLRVHGAELPETIFCVWPSS